MHMLHVLKVLSRHLVNVSTANRQSIPPSRTFLIGRKAFLQDFLLQSRLMEIARVFFSSSTPTAHSNGFLPTRHFALTRRIHVSNVPNKETHPCPLSCVG